MKKTTYTELVAKVKAKRTRRGMPREREKDLQGTMVKYLLHAGFEVVRINSGVSMESAGKRRYLAFYRWYGKIGSIDGRPRSSGIPDLFIMGRGHAFFIEVKTLKGAMRESQKDFARAAEGNIPTYVCRSLEDVEAVLVARGLPVPKLGTGVQGIQNLVNGWRGDGVDGDGDEG